MSDERPSLANLECLLGHLKANGPAAKLVGAALDPGEQSQQDALKQAILDRLAEVRREYEQPTDQQD